MCGIFAAMTRNGLSPERCDTALKLLEHRGPDGTGSWTSRDGQWTLGHTRLSIIGLRNGSQPMTSPDGAVHVVVNGEFYGCRELREDLRGRGYRFSSDSDSEIAVHLYRERGLQAATKLRGEFAVIIADERQREMIAIRDRFGVKPLYYAVVNGEVFFASERGSNQLLRHPPKSRHGRRRVRSPTSRRRELPSSEMDQTKGPYSPGPPRHTSPTFAATLCG
jgi:asparagine synthase (glutamine-hydrolysing)